MNNNQDICMKHKHYDCIVAWANGEKIEYKSKVDYQWEQIDHPQWLEDFEYRIARPKKRTETRWLWASDEGHISHFSKTPFWPYKKKIEWSATDFEATE